MFIDPLVLMPVERWGELKSALKADWPRSISGFILLETAESIIKFDCGYDFKVYCPFGNANNGIVAVNIKNTYYDLIVQCPNDDTNGVQEALRNTKIVEWSKIAELPYTSKHVFDCLLKLCIQKNCKIRDMLMSETFILDPETPPFDIKLSPDLSFKSLTVDYVQLVNDKWPHKYPGSEWYFNMLTKANLGYGLFNEKELLAWVFIKEMGALGHLYTLEKHRRKGYGELTIKLISNKLLEDNKYVIAFCVEGNATAANLYKKLGFKFVNELHWCSLVTDSSVNL